MIPLLSQLIYLATSLNNFKFVPVKKTFDFNKGKGELMEL
jgi:hypothetical protein